MGDFNKGWKREEYGIPRSGFPHSSVGRVGVQCRRPGLDPWVGKTSWRKKWQPTPVFLPGESHGQRSLGGYSPCSPRVGHDWSDLAAAGKNIKARVLITDPLTYQTQKQKEKRTTFTELVISKYLALYSSQRLSCFIQWVALSQIYRQTRDTRWPQCDLISKWVA